MQAYAIEKTKEREGKPNNLAKSKRTGRKTHLMGIGKSKRTGSKRSTGIKRKKRTTRSKRTPVSKRTT